MSKSSSNKIFISLILIMLVVLIVLLLQANNNGVSSVLLPSDLAKIQGQARQRIRLAGRVAAGSIDYQVEPELNLEFSIHDPKIKEPVVRVVYKGLKPDMFAVGRDVILDGTWQGSYFSATKLMTQCPSKYQPPEPEKQSNIQEQQ